MISRIEVDEKSLHLLVSALHQESDGKALERDLVRELQVVAEPALQAARAALLSMDVSGRYHSEPPLLATVAAHTTINVHLDGKRPGVSIRSSKSGMPRGFANAPKRLNEAKGWRHRVFGSDRWVVQRGRPGWFDDTITRFKPAAQRGAKQALDDVARRISVKTKG